MPAKQSIKFILDDRVVEIDFKGAEKLTPTTTVLQYLRSLPGHKGVKEGCGQGDCGACTVVLAEPDGRGDLVYKAVNSCLIFLPMIHGKQLITVENIAEEKDDNDIVLHPVQTALIRHDGTQCGYCTPGMAASMLALYKNHRNPSKETVEDALSGNLCRCTGYRSVVDAALEACKVKDDDHFTKNKEKTVNLLNTLNQETETVVIKARGHTYMKPFTVVEALKLRRDNPGAMVITGATDAALLKTKKHFVPEKILDLSALDELKLILEDHHRIVIGTGISLEEVRQYCVSRLPALAELLRVFGSLQIRNMATMGGNLMSASPIGDTLPMLIALGAKVRLLGNNKQRELPVENFITGYRKTDIHDDEIPALIMIPKPKKNVLIKSYKISKRTDLDISTVSACFRMVLTRENRVREIDIVYGGMADRPKRAAATAMVLKDELWSAALVEHAMQQLEKEFQPLSDARAAAGTRLIMAKNLLMKFWLDTRRPELTNS